MNAVLMEETVGTSGTHSSMPDTRPLPGTDSYFEVAGNTGLMHDQKPATGHHAALSCLLSGIKHNPLNLQLHIQRINLLLDLEDADGLKAALVDLYIALGDSGFRLKLRMLSLASPFLSPANNESFKRTIQSGLEAHNPLIGDLPGSVLSKGFIGRDKLLGPQTDASAGV